jgi:hypothetical protein
VWFGKPETIQTDWWEAPESLSKMPIKVNLAMAESPTSDRFAFALSLLETGLRMCPAEKSHNSDPVLKQSSPLSTVRFAEELSRKMGIFRVFRGKGRVNLSAVKTCWRRKCDSNPHYRLESRNPDVGVTCRRCGT